MSFRAPVEYDFQLQTLRKLRDAEVERVKIGNAIVARVNQELFAVAQAFAKTQEEPEGLMFDPNTLEFSRRDEAPTDLPVTELDEVEVVEEAS